MVISWACGLVRSVVAAGVFYVSDEMIAGIWYRGGGGWALVTLNSFRLSLIGVNHGPLPPMIGLVWRGKKNRRHPALLVCDLLSFYFDFQRLSALATLCVRAAHGLIPARGRVWRFSIWHSDIVPISLGRWALAWLMVSGIKCLG